ncbi:hypothetical protein C0989_005480 [Termitomyces sp. Mn162]|nr:hypothetical protein C0989_005480 [Termitomyces sp. Mn162]
MKVMGLTHRRIRRLLVPTPNPPAQAHSLPHRPRPPTHPSQHSRPSSPTSSPPCVRTHPSSNSTNSPQVTTPLPTALLPDPISQPHSSHRTATIAATALGTLFLLLLILVATFVYRRHRRKLRERLEALVSRRNAREHRGLLDGEDFFDDDEEGVRMKSRGLAPPYPPSSTTSRATTPLGIPPGAFELGALSGADVSTVNSSTSTNDPFRPSSAHDREESVYFDLPPAPVGLAITTPVSSPPSHTLSTSASTSTTTSSTSFASALASPVPPASVSQHTQPQSPRSSSGSTSPIVSASTSSPTQPTHPPLLPLPPGAAPPKRGV